MTLTIAVARHELINATCGIHKLRLTGIEWVRSVGDFQLEERIGFAINFNGVFGSSGRAAEELVNIGHIFENYHTIVLGMNTLFHNFVS